MFWYGSTLPMLLFLMSLSNGKAQASVPTLDYSMIKSARKIMSGFFKEGFSEGVISTLLKKIRHFLAKEFRTPIDW